MSTGPMRRSWSWNCASGSIPENGGLVRYGPEFAAFAI